MWICDFISITNTNKMKEETVYIPRECNYLSDYIDVLPGNCILPQIQYASKQGLPTSKQRSHRE